jgi:hypothetical protein
MPQAFQSDDPFRANVGGVNSVFFCADGDPTAEFDSWLTIGETAGNVHSQIGDTGFAWEQWTADTPLLSTNGAVFVEQPNFAPAFERTAIVVGQLTVADDAEIPQPVLNAQGTSVHGEVGDWAQHDIQFFLRHNAPIPPAQPPTAMSASALAAEQAAMEAHSTIMQRCVGVAIRPDGTCRAECTKMQRDMLSQCVGDCDHCVARTQMEDQGRRTIQVLRGAGSAGAARGIISVPLYIDNPCYLFTIHAD